MMNSWLYAMIVVGYMLLMRIHYLGDDKCVVVVKLVKMGQRGEVSFWWIGMDWWCCWVELG